jgi:hypothetical protein
VEASQSPTPLTGMWAPYTPPEIGEKLDTLVGVDAFVLVDAVVREPIEVTFTEKGEQVKKMRRPVDLRVATAEAGVTRLFSGFDAGIVGQVERLEPGNLPALCRIINTNPTGRGQTRGLELVQLLAGGADVAAIARAQSTPIMPVKGHEPADPIPY